MRSKDDDNPFEGIIDFNNDASSLMNSVGKFGKSTRSGVRNNPIFGGMGGWIQGLGDIFGFSARRNSNQYRDMITEDRVLGYQMSRDQSPDGLGVGGIQGAMGYGSGGGGRGFRWIPQGGHSSYGGGYYPQAPMAQQMPFPSEEELQLAVNTLHSTPQIQTGIQNLRAAGYQGNEAEATVQAYKDLYFVRYGRLPSPDLLLNSMVADAGRIRASGTVAAAPQQQIQSPPPPPAQTFPLERQQQPHNIAPQAYAPVQQQPTVPAASAAHFIQPSQALAAYMEGRGPQTQRDIIDTIEGRKNPDFLINLITFDVSHRDSPHHAAAVELAQALRQERGIDIQPYAVADSAQQYAQQQAAKVALPSVKLSCTQGAGDSLNCSLPNGKTVVLKQM